MASFWSTLLTDTLTAHPTDVRIRDAESLKGPRMGLNF